MAKPVRIGIIGGGNIAKYHVRAYQQLPDVEIIGVSDVVLGRAEAFIAELGLSGAKAFTDHRDLLALAPDGVSICTPNVAHYPTSMDSLNAGVHVLVEKPLSFTLDEAVEMARAARRTGKILTVGFQPRYDPNMELIKEIVRSGALGDIYYIETGGGRRRGMPGGTFIRKDLAGGGAVADIGCYSLDLALHAVGYPKPLTVSAITANRLGTSPEVHPEADRFEVEDFGAALIRLEGGVTLMFKIAWAMHMDTLGATMFLGSEAGLKLTPAGSGPWSGVWDGSVGSITLFRDEFGALTETAIPVQRHQQDNFAAKVHDFVRAVKEGGPAPIPADEIVRQQAIIDAIFRSAAAGREVEVTIPAI